MKHLFLDTNIFIHFQSYEQIPWGEIVGDEYKLIIAPIVLDELDKHKTNPNKKIARRVKNVLPKIEQGQTNADSITNACLPIPKDETFSKFNLSRNQQDHALLSSILEFGEQNGLENIIFISHDTGPRIRARQLGITVFELDEKYLLVEEDSQEEKELGHIKERYPAFIIEDTTENDIYTNMPVGLENLMSTQRRINSLFGINQPTAEQKEEYNQKLQKFYTKHAKIIKKKYTWDKILSNAVLLNLNISNNGTAPANDIDVFLTFPYSVKIFLYNNFPKFEKPKPPYKPKFSGDIDRDEFGINSVFNPPTIEYIHFMDKSVTKNTVKCCNIEHIGNDGTVIHYKYSDSLKHNLHFSLEPIWVGCKSNFKIQYKLLISNYPKPIEGELNINVTIKSV